MQEQLMKSIRDSYKRRVQSVQCIKIIGGCQHIPTVNLPLALEAGAVAPAQFLNDEFGDVSENMSILVMNTELKVLSVMDSVKGITW